MNCKQADLDEVKRAAKMLNETVDELPGFIDSFNIATKDLIQRFKSESPCEQYLLTSLKRWYNTYVALNDETKALTNGFATLEMHKRYYKSYVHDRKGDEKLKYYKNASDKFFIMCSLEGLEFELKRKRIPKHEVCVILDN